MLSRECIGVTHKRGGHRREPSAAGTLESGAGTMMSAKVGASATATVRVARTANDKTASRTARLRNALAFKILAQHFHESYAVNS